MREDLLAEGLCMLMMEAIMRIDGTEPRSEANAAWLKWHRDEYERLLTALGARRGPDPGIQDAPP